MNRFISLSIFLFYRLTITVPVHDVTIVGRVAYGDGFARMALGLADHLRDTCSVQLMPTHLDPKGVPRHILQMINKRSTSQPRVSILMDHLWTSVERPSDHMPVHGIKIAYSMHESTEIPPQWTTIINNNFDALIVPDRWLVEVYERCGVRKPIFVIPLGAYLEDFYVAPERQRNTPFTFGVSAAYCHRKNHLLLVEAFGRAFGNDPQVRLKIHGRFGPASVVNQIKQKIKQLKLKNVSLYKGVLEQKDYHAFLRSLDCYVLLSKGEGYSVSPREALALGLPCIITNNTAHEELCDSGFYRAVQARVMEPVERIYFTTFNFHCGQCFNCTLDDACIALKDVYEHYDQYKARAIEGRSWVMRYSWKEIAPYFKTVIAPKKVVLSNFNAISLDTLTTSDAELAKKYQTMM